MASGRTTGIVQCPECSETVKLPVEARHRSRTEAAIYFDLAPVRAHIASHQTPLTTELPPTAR